MPPHDEYNPKNKHFQLLRWIATVDARLQCYSPIYTFLFCWIWTNLILFFFGAVKQFKKFDDSDPLRWVGGLARGFGGTINLNFALILLLAAKLVLSQLRYLGVGSFLPMDQAMPEMHGLAGCFMLFASLVHGICQTIIGVSRNSWKSGFGEYTWVFITGYVLLLVAAVVVFVATPWFRGKHFEQFQIAHRIGAALSIPLLVIHGFHFNMISTYKWLVVPVVILLLELILRMKQTRVVTVRIRTGQNLGTSGNIVRLSFTRPFPYQSGQYAEICIPEIRKHEWHPFTISSSEHESEIKFFIKKVGDWTSDLHDLARKSEMQELNESLTVKVRGPYGAPAQHSGQYERIFLIAGGVGSTPMCSVAKRINHTITLRALEEKEIFRLRQSEAQNSPEKGPERKLVTWKTVRFIGNNAEINEAGRSMQLGSFPEDSEETAQVEHEFTPRCTFPRKSSESRLQKAPPANSAEIFELITGTMIYNTLTLWVLLSRFSLNLIFIAFDKVYVLKNNSGIFKLESFLIVDMILSIAFTFLIGFSTVIDLAVVKRYLFEDLFALIPISLLPIIFNALQLSGVTSAVGGYAPFNFFLVWPGLLILTIWRYFRILGSRALLAEMFQSSHRNTKSVDFLWTVRKSSDDQWLLDEFSKAFLFSNYIRLHRFMTKEDPPNINGTGAVKNMSRILSDGRGPLCTSHYGKPDWNSIFKQYTKNVPSGSTVGIFFCGPKAMGATVREAAMGSMIDSKKRGMRPSTEEGENIFLEQEEEAETSTSRSFNIRYVFREETFY